MPNYQILSKMAEKTEALQEGANLCMGKEGHGPLPLPPLSSLHLAYGGDKKLCLLAFLHHHHDWTHHQDTPASVLDG